MRSGRNLERAGGKVINRLLKNIYGISLLRSPARWAWGPGDRRPETEALSLSLGPAGLLRHISIPSSSTILPLLSPVSRAAAPHHVWVQNKETLFPKNLHTNNLITPALRFIQQTSSARKRKIALHAPSWGTAVRREMVFNSLWKIQQWRHCTFKSLLIVKPTANSPSCVLKSRFPTISLPIQRSEQSV